MNQAEKEPVDGAVFTVGTCLFREAQLRGCEAIAPKEAFLRQLAAQGGAVPVVAMSASAAHLAQAVAAGAKVTVSKPFADLDQLVALVARHCQRPHPCGSAPG